MSANPEIRKISAQVKRLARDADEINAETHAILKDAVKTARKVAPVGEFAVRQIHVYEKHQLSETAANSVLITPDMSEAEIELRLNMERANRAERHRKEVLEKASLYMSGVENRPVFHWCTQPSLASLKTQLEQKPPRYIKKYVDELHNKIARYKRFDELFSQKIVETLPCNWNQFYSSKEQGVAERRERDSYKSKTVNEAIAFMEEMADAANEILERKRALRAAKLAWHQT